jgi:hypothetical protein
MQIPKVPATVILVLLTFKFLVGAMEHLQGRQKLSTRWRRSVESAATFTRSITFSGYEWLVNDGCSVPARSSSVKNSRPANSLGHSRGVTVV